MGKQSKQKQKQKQKQKNATAITGTFRSRRRGGGIVIPENPDENKVLIPRTACSTALEGDRVKAAITRRSKTRPSSGIISRVLNHANKQLIGRIEHKKRCSVVTPLNEKIKRTVEVRRKPDPETVPDNSWVMVDITTWTSNPYEPLKGTFTELLGTDADPVLPVILRIRASGIMPEFPDEVEAEAEAIIQNKNKLRDRRRRKNFSTSQVFTIDPAGAKDFDDAVSLHRVDENGWQIGIHIADVSHYVREKTALDAEAYDRATSIYPVNQVVHMLPEKLSNGLCSLRPEEDKLTMSAVFTISRQGRISDVNLYNSRIRSEKRFTYEEVQGLFDASDREKGMAVEAGKKPRPYPVVSDELLEMLLHVREAARALRRQRFKRGALNLELSDVKILFDARGNVSDIQAKKAIEAHNLIEELMIAANEAVARTLEAHHFPALFRVHDEPDGERLKEIAPGLARVGIQVPAGGITREELQAALDKAQHHRAGRVVQRWVLRSMKRARYQEHNIGHFGLASKSYLHFTSPIRRYPDLVVHRLVKLLLERKAPDDPEVRRIKRNLKEMGRHTSEREERAQKIEWDAIDLLSLQYMKRYIGDLFEGFIAGISPGGFFVELCDFPVEGMVRVDQMNEYLELDERQSLWRSSSSGRTYGLGDKVRVVIDRIDALSGHMDLALIDPELKKSARPRRRKKTDKRKTQKQNSTGRRKDRRKGRRKKRS